MVRGYDDLLGKPGITAGILEGNCREGLQNSQLKDARIRERFMRRMATPPSNPQDRLKLSWSNWCFGLERFEAGAERLARAGIKYIELHGNHYGADLGYRPNETQRILGDYGIQVAGICGMYSADNDLSSNRGSVRQQAIDYIRRELEFGAAVGADYLLVVPGAVGRPSAYDNSEMERSAEALRLAAEEFAQTGISAAIEPIRSAEVSFCHTVAEAKEYLSLVDHPAIQHINGDVYHMLSEETHVGEAVIEAGKQLKNLHMADSNRRALGRGCLDLDTIIMALYVIGFDRPGCYVTPEPLGPGGDPYPAMHGKPDPELLDELVFGTAECFRQRENCVLEAVYA